MVAESQWLKILSFLYAQILYKKNDKKYISTLKRIIFLKMNSNFQLRIVYIRDAQLFQDKGPKNEKG